MRKMYKNILKVIAYTLILAVLGYFVFTMGKV